MLLALVVPVMVMHTYFYWQEHVLEKTFEMRMNADSGPETLVTLGFSLHDTGMLRWEHDREFEYHGMMYDVIDRYTIGDSIYYQCWPDHAESRLKNNVYRNLALDFGENPERKKQESRIFSFLKSLISPGLAKTLTLYECPVDAAVSREERQHYINHSIRPPTPPPKFV